MPLLVIGNKNFLGNNWETSLIYGERRALRSCWPWRSSERGQEKYILRSKQTTKQRHSLVLGLLTLWKLIGDMVHIPLFLSFLLLHSWKQGTDFLHPTNLNNQLQRHFVFQIGGCSRRESCVVDHYLLSQWHRSGGKIWKTVLCRSSSSLLSSDIYTRFWIKISVQRLQFQPQHKQFWCLTMKRASYP